MDLTLAVHTILLFYFGLEVAYPLSHLTTIGNQVWFGEFIDKIKSYFKSDKIKDAISWLSYTKIFICKPCHTFWITLGMSCMILPLYLSVIHSLVIYLIVNISSDDSKFI